MIEMPTGVNRIFIRVLATEDESWITTEDEKIIGNEE